MYYPGTVWSKTTIHVVTFAFQKDAEAVVTLAGGRYQPTSLSIRYTVGHAWYWVLTAQRILKGGSLSTKVDKLYTHQLCDDCVAGLDEVARVVDPQ